MFKFKVDILNELKKAGYSSYRIRQEKLVGEYTLQQVRKGVVPASLNFLGFVCTILNCQPGDILEYVPDKE